MTYYLDANIVSHLLKGNKEIFSKLSDLASNDHTISIPNIVYYEIKRGLLANGASTKLNRFINFAKVLVLVPGDFDHSVTGEKSQKVTREKDQKSHLTPLIIRFPEDCLKQFLPFL